MRCVLTDEGKILQSVHSGLCGNHASAQIPVGKVYRKGFFYPTIVSDAHELTTIDIYFWSFLGFLQGALNPDLFCSTSKKQRSSREGQWYDVNKNRNMKNGIGVEVMVLKLVKFKQTKEGGNRKAKSSLEERGKDDLVRAGSGERLTCDRMPPNYGLCRQQPS
uniref:Uncharacterized protein n=1 Tax=Oryza brachyantha TaxID=4533 RepID=J3M5L8_ORYBR